MNKSLLELLRKEDAEIANLKFYRNSVAEFISHAENKDEGYHEEACYRIASEYEKRAKESEKKLIEIRKELKEYFSFLMKLEDYQLPDERNI